MYQSLSHMFAVIFNENRTEIKKVHYLLINEYQAQHWPTQTPLVPTVFKQYDLK